MSALPYVVGGVITVAVVALFVYVSTFLWALSTVGLFLLEVASKA